MPSWASSPCSPESGCPAAVEATPFEPGGAPCYPCYMNILGISAFYHDSAAALVRDGEIVAAAQEERFTRRKHDADFPKHAIDYCLAQARMAPDQLDLVGFYEKPLVKFDRLLETYISYAPVGFLSFIRFLPLWLKQKLHMPREMDRGLDVDCDVLGAGSRELLDVTLGLHDHQMNVQGQLRRLPGRLHHERPDGDVGHEPSVHHVNVDEIGPCALHGLNFLA